MNEDRTFPRTAATGTPLRMRWRPSRGWRELLTGRTPDAVLDRIADGDPLGLRDLVAQRIRATAVLVDVDRVHLRALAAVAFRASSAGPPRKRREVVEVVDRVITEEVEDAALPSPLGEGSAERGVFETFAGPLELDPDALRSACEAFNACPAEERAAFFELVVERRTLDGAARALGEDPTRTARRARRALEVALQASGAPDTLPESVHERQGSELPSEEVER